MFFCRLLQTICALISPFVVQVQCCLQCPQRWFEARRRLVEVRSLIFLSWLRSHNTNVVCRYYPSIRSCIECLLSMVDVNKCFVGEYVPLWPDTAPQAMQLIKPPKDFLVSNLCVCIFSLLPIYSYVHLRSFPFVF